MYDLTKNLYIYIYAKIYTFELFDRYTSRTRASLATIPISNHGSKSAFGYSSVLVKNTFFKKKIFF